VKKEEKEKVFGALFSIFFLLLLLGTLRR